MSPDSKAPRDWKVVAEEASHEMNPERMMELVDELNRSFNERDKANPKPGAKKESA